MPACVFVQRTHVHVRKYLRMRLLAQVQVHNIFVARMSSEEFTEAWKSQAKKKRLEGLDWSQLSLRTVLVDPPRAGLDPGVRQGNIKQRNALRGWIRMEGKGGMHCEDCQGWREREGSHA